MKPTLKHTVLILIIMVLVLFSACTNSKPVEVASELPLENPPTATTNPTSTPINMSISVDTPTPKPRNTSEPTNTVTPSPTNTTEPTITPTVEPTPSLPPESPFTFTEERLAEQVGERSQFPIQPNSMDIYGVTIVQEKSILIFEDVEIDGPFEYITPGIIGIGWLNGSDGEPIQVAFLTSVLIHKAVTFTDTGLVDTEESGMYSLGHRWRSSPNLRSRTDRNQWQKLTEQEYYLRRAHDVDVVTGLPIHNYDDWEAADWSSDDNIRRPRNGFGDVWTISIGLPGNSFFPEGTTKDDIDDSEYGGGDIGHLVLGPWVNSLEDYSEGILNFVKTGDVSGLPTITVDGETFSLIPGYRSHWDFDLAEEDYQEE